MNTESSAKSARRQLLLGSGKNAKNKRIQWPDSPSPKFEDLVTVDIDPECKPNIVKDLNEFPYCFAEDNEFDEIHAYEVLEHLGRQGDYEFFFRQFNEFHRILKPGGFLCGTTPMWDSVWAWSDPGHTRILSKEMLTFLFEAHYEQVGRPDSAISDYRSLIKGFWEPVGFEEGDDQFGFILKTV